MREGEIIDENSAKCSAYETSPFYIFPSLVGWILSLGFLQADRKILTPVTSDPDPEHMVKANHPTLFLSR